MHARDLVRTVYDFCLVLADSGITVGCVVAAAVATCTGAVSVYISAGGASTMSVTAGALSFLLVFSLRAMIDGVAVDLQREEEEGQRSSCYR